MRPGSRSSASARTTSLRTRTSANKFAFTIDLLAGSAAGLLKAAGVEQTEFKGNKYWDRTSFVIDPKGTLRKVYEEVNPQGHEKLLLDDIKAMQKGRASPCTLVRKRIAASFSVFSADVQEARVFSDDVQEARVEDCLVP